MELTLQPTATLCCVSGRPFTDGEKVVSFLVRGTGLDILRYDVGDAESAAFAPAGAVVCRWRHLHKPRSSGSADRTLKLTAETLFLTLIDPLSEPTEENTRLLQFLALMLERKKLLRPRGRTADGQRALYEHSKTKQRFEVAADELTPEFFVRIQSQLSVLVGEPKPAPGPPPASGVAGAAAATVP